MPAFASWRWSLTSSCSRTSPNPSDAPLAYIDRFNARDFDAVRDMLAEEVRLDLVNKSRMHGRSEVGRYFHNYARLHDWHLVPGVIDGRPAILVQDPGDRRGPAQYLVLLQWKDERVVDIRDFRFACYVIDGADLRTLV